MVDEKTVATIFLPRKGKAMQCFRLNNATWFIGFFVFAAFQINGDCSGAPIDANVNGLERAFTFVSISEGQRVLSTEDAFVTQMSVFDRQVRLQSETDLGATQLLKFSADQVCAWTTDEKEVVTLAISRLEPKLRELKITWDEPIKIIKTTGREESDAAYTRGRAIVFPRSKIGKLDRPPTRLFAHELFHVISRSNPELRDRLFQLIGFQRVPLIRLPRHLEDMRITNPDAPKMEHVIRLSLDANEKVFATPFLFSKEAYTPAKKSLFAYLQFQLMQVIEDSNGEWMPVVSDQKARFISPDHPDYWRQIRGNTRYVIHPEEIMADNFSFLLTGEKPKDSLLLDEIKREFQQQE